MGRLILRLGYEIVDGEIPIIKIGKRILMLREPLRRMLEGESNQQR